jgi:Holliday junction DNA helicase RuvA
MISKLKGIVDEVTNSAVILDVGGVGYDLLCSTQTLSQLPPVGSPCTLHTDMVVREDSITLFGFLTVGERQWFRLLTTVQGVGNRVALSLLSLAEGHQLAQAISNQDKLFIARAEGVGPKLAARLITELKDKVDKLGVTASAQTSAVHLASFAGHSSGNSTAEDAVSALIALGYKPFEARTAVQNIYPANNNRLSTAELIRLALAKLGRFS